MADLTQVAVVSILRKLVAKHLALWLSDPDYPVDLETEVRTADDDPGEWAGPNGYAVIYCESGIPPWYDHGAESEWVAMYEAALRLGILLEPYNAAVVCAYPA